MSEQAVKNLHWLPAGQVSLTQDPHSSQATILKRLASGKRYRFGQSRGGVKLPLKHHIQQDHHLLDVIHVRKNCL
jgi:hypothetical protein